MTSIFITGTAGFIGFHLARLLLEQGHEVTGFDGMTEYYDVALKEARHAELAAHPGFTPVIGRLEDMARLEDAARAAAPGIIIHLAAQAGVRYSLENPRAYVETNLTGTFNLMEVARMLAPRHLMMASTSSVYGAATEMPFTETQATDRPLTIYAASKKANEVMGHAYAHLHGLPTTMFRFFTVYGPWGRPDMALFRFTRAILEGQPIDIYNRGEMYRDFTYVADLVRALALLAGRPPPGPEARAGLAPVAGDTLSPEAPFRVINIGNSTKVRLLDFVEAVETATGRRAIRNLMPMQPGDVPATWADAGLLERLTGYRPATGLQEGVARFVEWYRGYYGV